MRAPIRILVLLASVLCLSWTLPVIADDATETGKKAAELVKSADRAVAYVVKAARESNDPALADGVDDAEPFWQAAKKLNESVEKIDRGLFLKDDTFFTSLASATSAVEELKITFGMSGARDEAVKEGVEKVDAALSLLRENFSREAVRLEKGGELTEAERKQLDAVKAKQTDLQRKLKELEAKVGDNETLIQGIRRTQEKSRQISRCRHDVSGFAFAMTTMHIVHGWIWGWHWWWGPWGWWGPDFVHVSFDVYVDWVPDFDYDWGILDGDIDIGDLDIELPIEDAEIDTMDEWLDDGDFTVSDEEIVDFSADELDLEGEMDVIGLDEFEDFDFGDFDAGVTFDEF